jgi:aminodeoxyfutalosine deaminase
VTAPDTPRAWWAPWALPILSRPVRDALVTFAGGRITEVRGGVSREAAAAHEGVELFEGCVLAPGFVNTHAHLEYAAYDALADGLSFAGWIGDHIRRKRRLEPEHMRASAELGAWEAAAGGITTVADASFSGDAAHAMASVGLRGRVYLEVFGTEHEERQLDGVLERIAALPEAPGLEYGISPHAPYTVSERLYRLVAASGLPWMTHLLESADETELVQRGSGPLVAALAERGLPVPQWGGSPVQALADVLGPEVVAVHLVHADAADVEVLASTGAAVAHCPRSNARLGCGVMDLPRFERAGVQLGLGTDSPSSAGPLDMFDELRSALQLHRAVAQDASQPTAERLLELATVDAARALGYADIGVLAPGAAADVVACEIPTTADPARTYVLAGTPSRVRATMVAGRAIWRSDRNSLRAAAERASAARQLLALPVA